MAPAWREARLARVTVRAIALAAPLPSVVGLDAMGVEIPGIREGVAFVALFLVPGALLLHVLRVRDLGSWEFLVYACGLSLAFLMAVGLAVNGLHEVGVARPMSSVPLAIAIGATTALLAVAAFWRPDPFPIQVSVGELLKPYTVLLLLPVALVVLGTQMANTSQDNTFLLGAIGLLALLPLAAFSSRLLPEKAYPPAVVVIGLALLLHRSLISARLTGFDVHTEYYLANLVLDQGFWDRSIAHIYNSMLSVVMVPPMYSAVSSLDLLWVYKVIYPMLFSLMPLALFLAYRQILGARVAFLAACFFMFTQTFYQTMPHNPRMQMGLLYLALLLLTMRPGKTAQPVTLPLIFGAGLVASHYSVAYFFMPVLAVAVAVMLASQVLALGPFRVITPTMTPQANPTRGFRPSFVVTPNFARFFVVLAFFWYIYVSTESLTLEGAVQTVSRVTDHLRSDFLASASSEGMSLVTTALTPWRQVTRGFHFAFEFLMIVGVVRALVRWRRAPLPVELAVLALPALLVNGAAIFVPYFAGTLHLDRVYVLTLVFPSPFAITGGVATFQGLAYSVLLPVRALTRRGVGPDNSSVPRSGLVLLAVGLGMFLLLNTGFVNEIAQERPNAIPLSRQWVLANGNEWEKTAFLAAYPAEEDFVGAQWLVGHRVERLPIYADMNGQAYVLGEWIPVTETLALFPDTTIWGEAYVFLRYLNVQDGVMSEPYGGWRYRGWSVWWPFAELEPKLQQANVIYDNGGSRIYLSRSETSIRR